MLEQMPKPHNTDTNFYIFFEIYNDTDADTGTKNIYSI